MSPSTSRPGGRFLRPLAIFALVVAGLSLYGGYRLGTFLYDEDPLQPSDAIFVLAGSVMNRPLEAADLYLEGYAPALVLSDEVQDSAIAALEARGIAFPSDLDLTIDALEQLGVRRGDMMTTRPHDNTAAEAVTLRAMAGANGWQRVIVVSSKFHLRRAGFAFRRELDGTGVEVVMRGSRYDPADPDRWWATRRDWRWMLSEVPKMVAYLAGLGA